MFQPLLAVTIEWEELCTLALKRSLNSILVLLLLNVLALVFNFAWKVILTPTSQINDYPTKRNFELLFHADIRPLDKWMNVLYFDIIK